MLIVALTLTVLEMLSQYDANRRERKYVTLF